MSDRNEYGVSKATLKRLQDAEVQSNLYQLGLLVKDQPRPSDASRRKKPAKPKASKPKPSKPKPSKTVDFETEQSHYRRPPSLSSRVSDDRPPSQATHYHAKRTAVARNVGGGMSSVLDLERSRTRRDRTFIGAECAVCEEPLEHTLRGERILQLSCAHVAHEACFYEYIKEFESQYCPSCKSPLALDTTRGGNVLNLEKLGSIMRSAHQPTPPQHQQHPSHQPHHSSHHQAPLMRDSRQSGMTGMSGGWDNRTVSDIDGHLRPSHTLDNRDSRLRDSSQSNPLTLERTNSRNHYRNDSIVTGTGASSDYGESHMRRHDYDLQSMEMSLSSSRGSLKNPIAPPTVTVRSEFPTLTRSRQQQSLTCLVTVEVAESKWRPDLEDLRHVPPVPTHPSVDFSAPKSPPKQAAQPMPSQEELDTITDDLQKRVDHWHGLDFTRFGKLRLHGQIRVGKDRQSWQDLECYLFSEMLICVKEKKIPSPPAWDGSDAEVKKTKCTLKGSILIRKHLQNVQTSQDEVEPVLTLSLSVPELPSFHLKFQNRGQLELWRGALLDLNGLEQQTQQTDYEHENSGTDDDEYRNSFKIKRVSSVNSYGAARSYHTAPTEYSRIGSIDQRMIVVSPHVPLDVVVVIPVSSSMQGLKINLLRDTLRFLVHNLGDRDRMGLVTFGSSGGGVPMVGMTGKTWSGWNKVLDSIRPVGQKSLRADVVEGANVAMDLLMQRKSANPLASILLISDSSTSDPESVDFVVSRAEAAKVAIHSFGLGLTHKPDTMIELSTRTKASYTYVKDWMMLRECVAGCLGSLQTTSHQNAKLKLRLPEGSPAKFVKISGALHITKRATGRDAEAALGDLRFGDKRDILVQLAIAPDSGSPEQTPQDAWESLVSGLEALGGPLDSEDQRSLSVEEVPLIQADLIYGDVLRDGTVTHLPRPSLLTITMLPFSGRSKSMLIRPFSPPIPPHPFVVQRRMELLTSDMLTRALTLVSRGQHERAHHLLTETRSILKGLGKGGLPPLPPPPSANGHPSSTRSQSNNSPVSGAPASVKDLGSNPTTPNPTIASHSPSRQHTPSPPPPAGMPAPHPLAPAPTGIDQTTMAALDAELESALEWILHPAVFGRDARKAVLQAIGVISSQRGYTFRSKIEGMWAGRVGGVGRCVQRSRDWRESGGEGIMEEV